MLTRVPFGLLLLVCCGSVFSAFGEDAEGCKDSPMVSRMPGSTLVGCDHKEFDSLTVIVAVDKDENATERNLEGDHSWWDYEGREGVTSVQTFRNYQNALKVAGFTSVYHRSPDYQVARKGDVWVRVDSSGGGNAYNIHIVKIKAMEQEVAVDAAALGSELEKAGRVSVYGIQFETGKSTILPASEQVLGEVLKMLQTAGELKVRVEGHTDNVGGAALNDRLSNDRARAVMSWLTSHGIAAARLQAQGFGDTKPVADNSTEEGRARNRRVDLVRQ